MDIEIQTTNTQLKAADDEFVRYRIAFSLEDNWPAIDKVLVRIREIPGFDLEYINQCVVEIRLLDGSTLSGDSTASDLHIAIHRAADRAGTMVARHVELYAEAVERLEPAGFRTARAVGDYQPDSNRPN